MPRCFQLLRDGVAVALIDVDEEMCRHFGAECHESRWFAGWYDFIGFGLATGDGGRLRRDQARLRS